MRAQGKKASLFDKSDITHPCRGLCKLLGLIVVAPFLLWYGVWRVVEVRIGARLLRVAVVLQRDCLIEESNCLALVPK